MKKFELKNGIKTAFRQNKNTPRVAFCLNFTINNPEKYAGTYSLMSRLLLQGTKNRTSEQLAIELDENAIELCVDMKQDYLRFKFVCLNEDFDKAMEILSDVLKNSTFEEFEKEIVKMQGEITAELDSARTKVLDNYFKNIFAGHYYGNTYTKVLEDIEKIQKSDVTDAYAQITTEGRKVISFVGDLEFDNVKNTLDKYIGDIENSVVGTNKIETPILKESKTVEIIKADAQQAQIIQGWVVPTFDSADYPALVLLNVILGSSGLSSRLFVELRDKKGLAYVVRSAYETYAKCASFSVYIATEPKNIQVSLDGFTEEIKKLKETPVEDFELENAINNVTGKQEFVLETNSQQSNILAYYGCMGLGFDFQEKILENLKKVTPAQIQECANKYLGDTSVISILKP